MHDDLALELAKEAVLLSANCALALASMELLDARSLGETEASLRRCAEICRKGGAQVQETDFVRAADRLAEQRDKPPSP